MVGVSYTLLLQVIFIVLEFVVHRKNNVQNFVGNILRWALIMQMRKQNVNAQHSDGLRSLTKMIEKKMFWRVLSTSMAFYYSINTNVKHFFLHMLVANC